MVQDAHPLACSFSRMASASTAMQATISCDITCPCEFQTSQRLGPSMSITCAAAAHKRQQMLCLTSDTSDTSASRVGRCQLVGPVLISLVNILQQLYVVMDMQSYCLAVTMSVFRSFGCKIPSVKSSQQDQGPHHDVVVTLPALEVHPRDAVDASKRPVGP